LTASWDNNRPK